MNGGRPHSAGQPAAQAAGRHVDPFGLVGTVLEGQYRADAVVGEGGFGVVYRGRHLSLEQPIAIKVLKGLDGGDPTINALVLEKFRAEARLLYTLSQSSLNIVRALDFGAAVMPNGAWAPFMILEWLDGRSLADDLSERRRQGYRGRSLEEALAILQPIADGLGIAHKKLVAHRDIKPANVFLLAGAGGPAVKVLDFGIAKIMKEGESAGTKGTFASFTWLYATPEQLDPRVGQTGLETDVYAFALLVTELLTDRAPIDDHDVVGIMRTALNPTRRPTPRTLGANVPDDIEAICLRALAVDPKARYASIVDLWSAIASRDRRLGTAMQPMSVKAPSPPSFLLDAPSPSSPRVAYGTTAMPPMSSAAGSSTGTRAGITGPVAPLPAGLVPPPGPPVGLGLPPPAPMASPFPPYGHSGAGPMTHNPMSPPLGTAPPGRRAPAYFRQEGTSPVVYVTIAFFVITLLFAATCAAIGGVVRG